MTKTMKKLFENPIIQKAAPVLCAYIPVALAFLLYPGGAPASIGLFLAALGLLFYWYWSTAQHWWSMLLYGLNHTFAAVLASQITTQLYYSRVSDDGMTIAVGRLEAWAIFYVSFFLTAILVLLKLGIQKKH